jgi:hypothetical protein
MEKDVCFLYYISLPQPSKIGSSPEQAVSFFHEMEQMVPNGDLELQTLLHYGQARLAASQGKIQQALILGEASAAAFENAGNYRFHEIRRWLKSVQDSGDL